MKKKQKKGPFYETPCIRWELEREARNLIAQTANAVTDRQTDGETFCCTVCQ